MATAISFGAYSAAVHVNGSAVRVYSVKSDPVKRVTTAYIEATPGASFSVVGTVALHPQPFGVTSYRVFLDGTNHVNQLFYPGSTTSIAGRRVGYDELQSFQFAKLNTTDDDEEASRDENLLKELGSIRISLHEVIITGAPQANYGTAAANAGPVHERSKKATMDQQTQLGARIKSDTVNQTTAVQWMDPPDFPYATLIFHYRSRALLEMEGIVVAPLAQVGASRSPSPAAAAAAGPIVPKPERKPTVKRPTETVVISDSEEEDVKPPPPKKKKSDGPPEVIVIE